MTYPSNSSAPISPPNDQEFLADLQARYPEISTKLDEFDAALKTYPDKIESEEVAAALQDLLGQMAKQRAAIKAYQSAEKKPWDGLVKIVRNFFGKAEDRIDAALEMWKPRHQAYLDQKAAASRRAAEEEAERQRQEAERLRAEAEAAAERKRQAEEAEAAARRAEEEARRRAEEEAKKREEAEAAAAAAKEEERRIAAEKKAREDAERAENKKILVFIRGVMTDVEALEAACAAESATGEDVAALDELIGAGGKVSQDLSKVGSSHLLDDMQTAEVAGIRSRLAEIRQAATARSDSKERRRRAKAEKEAAEREAALSAERNRLKDEEDARLAKAKAEREEAEAAAAAAKEEEKAAKAEIREARADQRDAFAEQKNASRAAASLGTEADRTENRADRMDRKLERSTEADFGRVLGDLGTVGSNTGRWTYSVVDEAALRAASGPLGPHFNADALGSACYHWMAAHRDQFTGERVEGLLPGVIFVWERSVRIV
jgi:hypothetical protein